MKNKRMLTSFMALSGSLVLLLSACLPILSQTQSPPQDQMETAVYATLTAMPADTQVIQEPTSLKPSPTSGGAAPTQSMTTATPEPLASATMENLLPASAVIEGLACIPRNTQQDLAVVLRVIDGDTILAIINGEVKTIKYIGIDTPALATASQTAARMAAQAYNLNKFLVEGRVVVLVKDVSDTDAAGNLLRYVLVDDLFVNYNLVKQGLAVALAVPPDVTCRATLEAAQLEAMNKKVGLWQQTPTASPRPNNLPSLTPTFAKSNH